MNHYLSPCLCGADDCRKCNPGNFSKIGGRWVYCEDIEDIEEIEEIEEEREGEE